MQQKEVFGIGSTARLGEILAKMESKKIFLVTGKSSYQSSGAQEKIDQILSRYKVVHFSDFMQNPQFEDVQKGLVLFRKEMPDVVVAVGGGSVLDIAKSINILAAYGDDTQKYIRRELPLKNEGKPLVAIPTTSGTGSEATHFAVVYIKHKKYSLAHRDYMLPNYVILDPSLTFSLPPKITAATGVDALAQAVEAYWSVHSTEESKAYAKEAIPLILTHLETAVNNPTKESRIGMMKAANLAGKSINISFTTACHSLSYPLTSYFNIPHGHAVALTLGEIFVFNELIREDDCLDQRGNAYVQNTMKELIKLFGGRTAQEVNKKLKQLMDAIGLERNLYKLGVRTPADIELIIKDGFNSERMKNNPHKLTEDDVRRILSGIVAKNSSARN